MLAALARGLRLSLDERDHLFQLGGYPSPRRAGRSDLVDAGLMRILDRLANPPAMVVSGAGETLAQTPPAVALFGDETVHEGLARSVVYRWYTDPAWRTIYPAEDRAVRGRDFTARPPPRLHPRRARLPGAEIVDALTAASAEFRAVWAEHEVARKDSKTKRIAHPEVGRLEIHCQTLYDVDQSQGLLVFTATPGSESADKLRLLAVLGRQTL
jgi:hypothetical protein